MPVIRTELNAALKTAMKTQEKCGIRTIRLILAALKDRDIGARAEGNDAGVPDADILSLLETMVKQRTESSRTYEDAGRMDLAEQEREEIKVIRRFMPEPLEGEALDAAVSNAIRTLGARDMKDMSRTMAFLKETYTGRMDFSRASGIVRQILAQ